MKNLLFTILLIAIGLTLNSFRNENDSKHNLVETLDNHSPEKTIQNINKQKLEKLKQKIAERKISN